MTFSIVARDAATGALGVAVTTSVACVGALAPHVSRYAAVATQAYVKVDIGLAAMQLTAMGVPVDEALRCVLDHEPDVQMRQVTGIDRKGRTFAHSGKETLPYHGHVVCQDHVVAGNSLRGEEVLHAVSESYQKGDGHEFTWRLIHALAEGIRRGGERETEALESSLPSSAAVVVAAPRPRAFHNLRVDAADDAVGELERVYTEAVRSAESLERFYAGVVEIVPTYWRTVSIGQKSGE